MPGEAEADRKLVENERAKLTATYVNGIAVATFAVGTLAPLIAAGSTIRDVDFGLATGIAHVTINAPGASLAISVICFGVSALLHSVARRALGALRS